ncbi:MAG: hypothetical protein LKG17_06690 [Megasphaera sp.]|nr:hypothetical protein [Megasphaera sp.]
MLKKMWQVLLILGLTLLVQSPAALANSTDYSNGYYAGRHDGIQRPADSSRYRTAYVSPQRSPANRTDWNAGYLGGLETRIGRNNITYQTQQLQMQTGYLTELSPSIRPHKQLIMQPYRPGLHQPLPLPIRPAAMGLAGANHRPLSLQPHYTPASVRPIALPEPVVRPLDQPAHPGPQPFCPYVRR